MFIDTFICLCMALLALAAAFLLRHRPHPTSRPSRSADLPHVGQMLGLPTLFWSIGALCGHARPFAQWRGVQLDEVALLGLMAVGTLLCLGHALSKAHPLRTLGLNQILMWGGVISGVQFSTGQSDHALGWAMWGAGALACTMLLVPQLDARSEERSWDRELCA